MKALMANFNTAFASTASYSAAAGSCCPRGFFNMPSVNNAISVDTVLVSIFVSVISALAIGASAFVVVLSILALVLSGIISVGVVIRSKTESRNKPVNMF